MKTLSSRFENTSAPITPRVRASLSASALLNNYRILHEQVGDLEVLPMIKANAYGHGAVWAARNLLEESGLNGLGVATLEEGKELREELGSRARRTRIVVFSGVLPWSESKGQYCERHGLTPVISSDEDWRLFLSQGWPERVPYELKFNTGMNRLGIHPSSARKIAEELAKKPAEWLPHGVMSHLATAEDDPTKDSPNLAATQLERFLSIRKEFSSRFSSLRFHLGNSSAIWNQKKWRLQDFTDLVRPGISLYGVPPWPKAPIKGLLPVMTLEGQVISVSTPKNGEKVGYGGTYEFKKASENARLAIIAAGYADGIHRALSNSGQVWLGDSLAPIVGIVSMDLCAVLTSSKVKVGDWAQFIGGQVDAWEQSKTAHTVPYELLTSVSARVHREYE